MQQQNQDIQNDLFTLALMFIIVFYLIFILPVQLLNRSYYKPKKLQSTIIPASTIDFIDEDLNIRFINFK